MIDALREDEDGGVRKAAASALALLGDQAGLPSLVEHRCWGALLELEDVVVLEGSRVVQCTTLQLNPELLPKA